MRLKPDISETKGFTLIEIIVTLVAAGILALFYFHFMGTAMDYSWRSVELVAGEILDLQTVKESSIGISDYKTTGVWAVMNEKKEWLVQKIFEGSSFSMAADSDIQSPT